MRTVSVFGLVQCCCLVISISAVEDNYISCNCDTEGYWSVNSILESQRVSDFLITLAYFSIPLELLYFLRFSNVPFKLVMVEFIAFIVLCGITHFLTGLTYYYPHSFRLLLFLTIAKLLTATVSCATAISLVTLIPLLLKFKVRELFLRQNVQELDQEVEVMKRKNEACSNVTMLTQEIRRSLDRHTILHKALVELSNTFGLLNCAVWMPDDDNNRMTAVHMLRASSFWNYDLSISTNDPDVQEINREEVARILKPDSALGVASCGGSDESGGVAAIRMPMLRVSHFKTGTPQLMQTSYAILVLVLPSCWAWSYQDMELIEVVADQVAVALSHAAVLEESQLMRQKLSEQNLALLMTRKNVMMTKQARSSFQKVLSHGTMRPMQTIMGLLSIIQREDLNFDLKMIVDTLIKTISVMLMLVNDAIMVFSSSENAEVQLEMKLFKLHSMIKEASCLAKCLCVFSGLGFRVDVGSNLPAHMIGDEKKTFQVIVHLVGYLLDLHMHGGARSSLAFHVKSTEYGGEEKEKRVLKSTMPEGNAYIRFELGMESLGTRKQNHDETVLESSSFRTCKKLVQMMRGNVWISRSCEGLAQSTTIALQFQVPTHVNETMYALERSPQEAETLASEFKGLRVLVADGDDMNRAVMQKMLEKLGCEVDAVASGLECLGAVIYGQNSYRVVILDLYTPKVDGFEVAKRIWKARGRTWPLIIALTKAHRVHKCLSTGINGAIQKPLLLQELADELRRLLLPRLGEGFQGSKFYM